MKKLISAALAMALALGLVACGSSSTTTTTTTTTAEATTTTTEAATTTESTGYTGGTYEITAGTICTETHLQTLALYAFKDYVEEASDGNITVTVFANGALGGDEAMLEAVAMGTLTMCAPSASLYGNYVDAWNILAMPYLFPDTDTAFDAVTGDLGDLLNEKIVEANLGFYNLGFMFNGIRNMTNNVRPIETLDDLSGLKMRCMTNQTYIDLFTCLGANATPMSFDELYTGMAQGTVHGQENPASLIYESMFQEVQAYISNTEHVYDFVSLPINSAFYDSLDDEAKAIIDEATQVVMHDWQMQKEVDDNAAFIDLLVEAGMTYTEITAEDKLAFMDAVAPMYETAEADFGADVMAIVAQYR